MIPSAEEFQLGGRFIADHHQVFSVPAREMPAIVFADVLIRFPIISGQSKKAAAAVGEQRRAGRGFGERHGEANRGHQEQKIFIEHMQAVSCGNQGNVNQ